MDTLVTDENTMVSFGRKSLNFGVMTALDGELGHFLNCASLDTSLKHSEARFLLLQNGDDVA